MFKKSKNNGPISTTLSWEEKNPILYVYKGSETLTKLRLETEKAKEKLGK